MFRNECVDEYITEIRRILQNFKTVYGFVDKYYEVHKRVRNRGYAHILNALATTDGDIDQAASYLLDNHPRTSLTSRLNQHDSFITIQQVLNHIDVNYNLTTTLPDTFEFRTDRDINVANYIDENLETIVERYFKSCNMFVGNIKLLPEQVLLVIWNTLVLPMPIEASVTCHDHYFMKRDYYKVRIPENTPMKFHINTSMPGSGKTVILANTAMRLINDDRVFNQYLHAHQNPKDIVDYGGFSTNIVYEKHYLARVFLIISPVALKAQTYETMKKVVYNTDVVVWYNIDKRNMKTAYESGKKIVWIVPMNQTTTAMLREEPLYDFVGSGMDECNSSMAKHGNFPESEPMTCIITQATPEKLSEDMVTKPNHKLRKALGWSVIPERRINDDNVSAFLKAQLMFTPSFIRNALNEKAIQKMPVGFHCYSLSCNFVNLRTALTGASSDFLAPVNIREFLQSIIQPHATQIGSIRPADYNELTERITDTALTVDVISQVLTDAINMIKCPDMASLQYKRTVEQSKNDLARLKQNLDQVFENTLECPVLLIPITRANAVILDCCLNVISKEADDNLQSHNTTTCPMCRTQRRAPITMDIEETQEDSTGFEIIPNENIVLTIDRLSALRNNPIDAIASLIIAHISSNPSARILLMSWRYLRGTIDGMPGISRINKLVVDKFPMVKFVDSSGRTKVNVAKFNAPLKNPDPQVVLMDINQQSHTAQGLDLYATTLSIMAGDARAGIKLQVLMRSSRMGIDPTNLHPRTIVSIIQ